MNDTALIQEIEAKYSNTAGLVIQKSGKLIYEKYFDGYKETDTLHLFSVTKSITSILIGMAIDQGYIKSVDQKILEFFPDYTMKRGEKTIQSITLKNILTMTAPYKYKSEPYTKVYGSEDWTKAGLDLLGGKKPIGDFKYSTVGAQILSGVLQNAVGKPVLEFASENLFTPLGINTPTPTGFANKDEHMAFFKDKYVSGWVVDPQGSPTTGWGLTLCPKDMAKIGQLCLNQGTWNNKQLVSASWIKESTKEHARWNEFPYGYLWWNFDSDGSGAFAALGDSGNAIYINPKEQVVISIAARFKPRAKLVIELINKCILPIIK
ncbi:MAG: class C beta-lactamase-related serine hydrolase [Clostridia bacterium]|nr:class C beta-lactamase-related serine hydrolase [Clostridia bacterium]